MSKRDLLVAVTLAGAGLVLALLVKFIAPGTAE